VNGQDQSPAATTTKTLDSHYTEGLVGTILGFLFLIDCFILNDMKSTVRYKWIHLGFIPGCVVIPPASLSSSF